MDPVHPDDLQTVVRLLAYGRSGFSVLDPQRFPYSQPELREIEGASYTALPLLGMKGRMNQTCSAFGRVQHRLSHGAIKETSNLLHVALQHASAGDSRCAKPNTTGNHGLGVTGHGVLVKS